MDFFFKAEVKCLEYFKHSSALLNSILNGGSGEVIYWQWEDEMREEMVHPAHSQMV